MWPDTLWNAPVLVSEFRKCNFTPQPCLSSNMGSKKKIISQAVNVTIIYLVFQILKESLTDIKASWSICYSNNHLNNIKCDMQGHVLCNTSSNVCLSVSYHVVSMFWQNITYWNKGGYMFLWNLLCSLFSFLFLVCFLIEQFTLFYLLECHQKIDLPAIIRCTIVQGNYDCYGWQCQSSPPSKWSAERAHHFPFCVAENCQIKPGGISQVVAFFTLCHTKPFGSRCYRKKKYELKCFKKGPAWCFSAYIEIIQQM